MVILTGSDKGVFDQILTEIASLRQSHQQSQREYDILRSRNIQLAAALASAQQSNGRHEFQAMAHRTKVLKKLGVAWTKKNRLRS
jgi:hypothetical protein